MTGVGHFDREVMKWLFPCVVDMLVELPEFASSAATGNQHVVDITDGWDGDR